MTFEERRVGQTVVVDLKGKLTLGSADVRLRQVVRDLLSRGEKKIVLDVGGVSYMDSAGVGELVASYTAAEAQGAEMKLLNLTSKVHDLLQYTQLITVFETFDDEAEAVSSFE